MRQEGRRGGGGSGEPRAGSGRHGRVRSGGVPDGRPVARPGRPLRRCCCLGGARVGVVAARPRGGAATGPRRGRRGRRRQAKRCWRRGRPRKGGGLEPGRGGAGRGQGQEGPGPGRGGGAARAGRGHGGVPIRVVGGQAVRAGRAGGGAQVQSGGGVGEGRRRRREPRPTRRRAGARLLARFGPCPDGERGHRMAAGQASQADGRRPGGGGQDRAGGDGPGLRP
mmetsp:Transcript_37487/g.83832  ORF Transcript_37487/g.83832 Transcript_37487/m.83832 type:complete len:224 (-) Transcript_37487:2176-2847(-)